MKRWCIARMIAADDGDRSPAYLKYATQQNPINHRLWSNDADDWAIAEIACRNIGQLQSDPDIVIFPDAMLLDVRWDMFPSGTRTNLLNKAQAANFQTAAVGPNWANRDLLSYFVGQRQAGINIEQGHLSDV